MGRRSRSRSRERHRRRRSRSRSPRRRRSRSSDRRQEPKREIKEEREIKTEEEFDRRQDDARRRRENRHVAGRREGYVKQERQSEERGAGSSNPFAAELRNAGEWGKAEDGIDKKTGKPVEKEKVNLGLSGALTADQNTYKGVVIKYSEPPEAKIPKKKWRLYPFKGEELLKIIYLHRQSAYLIGRLAHVCEIPVDHPSCSKQHAALQFRAVKVQKKTGREVLAVKPYIIDLESSNGTFLNNQKLDPKRYYELRERDVIKFGFSTREYVLLHEKSDTQEVHESSSSEEEVSDNDE